MFRKLKDRVTNKKGFTLVELIVVIVIILVLAAVMVPNV
ncbi:MAG: prepilin-type N-terminal cleavage/methylation domain-containing protein, partial [Eubacterium sp.]|nr:prepilin-type N-terminal cleavage/methylation domain-containing protein [Eubacterium sp.]